ncbi:hypothetical protein Tco_1470001, partial [Tanacetum coccineum]
MQGTSLSFPLEQEKPIPRNSEASYGLSVLVLVFRIFTDMSIFTEPLSETVPRSLSLLCSQIALIMRNKPDIDQGDIDDLYKNLRVYEDEMKRSSIFTSNSQNLAFLS